MGIWAAMRGSWPLCEGSGHEGTSASGSEALQQRDGTWTCSDCEGAGGCSDCDGPKRLRRRLVVASCRLVIGSSSPRPSIALSSPKRVRVRGPWRGVVNVAPRTPPRRVAGPAPALAPPCLMHLDAAVMHLLPAHSSRRCVVASSRDDEPHVPIVLAHVVPTKKRRSLLVGVRLKAAGRGGFGETGGWEVGPIWAEAPRSPSRRRSSSSPCRRRRVIAEPS